jgi:hypothetical protein
MGTLADAPRVSEVEAKGHDALARFSCGVEHVWEREVNDTVCKLARTGGPPGTRPYVAEDTSPGAEGAFIGVASFFPWWVGDDFPSLPLPRIDDAICIQALAITEDYRRSLVPDDDDEVRIGAWLLAWTLDEIGSVWSGERRPVWGLVHKENERCQRMLGGQDFEPYVVNGPYDVWVRGRHAAAIP